MEGKRQDRKPLRAALALCAGLLFAFLAARLHAQTYNIIHTFMGQGDGEGPVAGLTIDKAGNFYGTTGRGGTHGGGTVYRLSNKNGSWLLTPLYDFAGIDGAGPQARVVFGPDGALYGTTFGGGCGNAGIVFNLRPPASACKSALCPWKETILYCFNQAGTAPGYGDLIFDPAGNLYGTTELGGDHNLGMVFELTPSNGGWSESIVHSFGAGTDGRVPYAGVTFDSAGNLYGTTTEGGSLSRGVVYQLVPSGGSWAENILYDFQGKDDGAFPYSSFILDQSGNLVGTTSYAGENGGGTVFEMTQSGGLWNLNTLIGLTNFAQPLGALTMNSAGNLYGTTFGGGQFNRGSVFKLTLSGGVWTQTVLYSFTDKEDGGHPYGSVVLDADGNIYGTANTGGRGQCSGGCGVIWEITP